MKEAFSDYVVNNFDMNEKNIKRKMAHSLRIGQMAINIAIYEKFDSVDYTTVEMASLLHDYARFPQWTIYKTFFDRDSFDHGDYAVELLFNNNEIKDYTTDVRIYDEIYDAIKYHNKAKVPENISAHNLKMLNVVRDADKLDNLYLWSIGDVPYHYFESSEPVSADVKKAFDNQEPILITDEVRDNPNNAVMVLLAWVYDLKSKYAFVYLKENKILEKTYEQLFHKEMFTDYFKKIYKYIDSKAGDINA